MLQYLEGMHAITVPSDGENGYSYSTFRDLDTYQQLRMVILLYREIPGNSQAYFYPVRWMNE